MGEIKSSLELAMERSKKYVVSDEDRASIKEREILQKATGGVLFIDEAYYLNRPENERDYGPEAIEILLQVRVHIAC